MLVRSEKYPELRVTGVVRFRGGEAEVTDEAALERLRRLGGLGVVVPEPEQEPEVVEAEEAPAPRKRRASKSE